MRYYVANTSPAMMFGIEGDKVRQASRQMSFTQGWKFSRLRGFFKLRRIGFFEVVRNAS